MVGRVPAAVPLRQHPRGYEKDFEPKNRKKFCARIATGEYDAVIIGHSQFEKIPVSMERQQRLLAEQIFEVEEGLRELKSQRAERFTIKSLSAPSAALKPSSKAPGQLPKG